jgi:hypothetical protein
MKAFQLFVDHKPYMSFKRFVWRLQDDFILRLGGVQLKLDSDKRLGINPVYFPLFSWKNRRCSRELILYFENVSYTFLLSNGFYIFKSTYRGIREDE